MTHPSKEHKRLLKEVEESKGEKAEREFRFSFAGYCEAVDGLNDMGDFQVAMEKAKAEYGRDKRRHESNLRRAKQTVAYFIYGVRYDQLTPMPESISKEVDRLCEEWRIGCL